MTQQHEPHQTAASSSASAGSSAVAGDRGADERRRARTDYRSSMSGLDNASVMGVELMVAIVVWTGIGWLLDRWLGTEPVLMIVGALIGNSAGLYLIWLRSGRMDDAERRAADQRARPRVVTSPVTAVMDAVVAGRTGIPTSAHTHGIGVERGSGAVASDTLASDTLASDTVASDTLASDTLAGDDGDARGGRLLER